MAFVIADRVRETSTTTGTGNFTLAGAVTGYQTFDAALDTGDTTYYTITDQSGANWEVGIGTFPSPSTLARTTILSSSNGGSVVTFTSGTKDVFISLPASKTVQSFSAGSTGLTPSTASFGAVALAGTLVPANGGTGTSTAFTAGSVVFAGASGVYAQDNASLFFDDTNNRLGIGTASPDAALTVNTVASFGAGAAALPSIAAKGDLNTGMWFPAADTIAASTGGSERLRIDSSGNVGIGTSSPGNAKLNTQGFGSYRGNAYTIASFAANSTLAPLNIVQATDGTIPGISAGQNSSAVFSALGFYTGEAERMRIDTSGILCIGTTNQLPGYGNNTYGVALQGDGTSCFSKGGNITTVINNGSSSQILTQYNYQGNYVGQVVLNGTTGVLYQTASDYRLKHDVQPLTSGLATIASLKPTTYKWNTDNSYGEGFIAHELQAIIPQAVTGEKDAVNDDGSIKAQGVDYSKIVVHLVAAIQELKADFDAYKAAHP
jgi:hypothetical protein